MGVFTLAENEFNIDSFLNEHSSSYLGSWYDRDGEVTYILHEDGICDIVYFGQKKRTTYAVNGNQIIINFPWFIDNKAFGDARDAVEFKYTLTNGELIYGEGKSDESNKTRRYVTPKTAQDRFAEVAGKWEWEKIKDLYGWQIELFPDGTGVINIMLDGYDNKAAISYDYQPLGSLGYLQFEEELVIYKQGETLVFLIQEDGNMLLGSIILNKVD